MKVDPQKLLEKFKKLPEDLKVVLFSQESATKIGAVGKKNDLSSSNIGILADETGLVLFGVLHPKDFIPDLSEKLGVDKETAKKIAEDVNREIFQKVRVSLRKLYGITDEITENVPVPAPAPIQKAPPPPPIPKPQPQPPKIIIRENVEIPKEAPKEELKPLEIRPIKGGPLGDNESTGKKPASPALSADRPAGMLPEPEKISPRPQLDFPPRRSQEPERDMGLKIMPHSPEEIKPVKPLSSPKPPSPPPGMAFIAEKKLEPPAPPKPASPAGRPSYDQYRERI
ncbi:hypothetical protein A3C75_00685 [Candidatus Giovannonibacteria bacterium RIFCSPHIGHO2_02_FULL_44_31]|uniref:Uncharacterized protein n=1 Tax=Candidatus Giovannonibacteria bacterium RIFCSPLOWO2_12_FULL_44_15 TaxID=1798364 RepID=A0A1F5Y083_9BACT|nr:MAG: hypothetical protein A3C75_00685 [Candidatus Giovannonibacteria bacterium RIFCSPHIGHO2_02_FULL_44_31]OGF76230.1 MAG: hypothetical protein A3E62_03805 [Candidatus Giovannonibacteria bacterium RIFCSPHIGHO2_12_FULL_44_29]OGF93587.1 MAG: hypothetical protein A3G54_03310 [Candidatus Giovannonibacteria bacterium RIFCSPLOWO2_12_FULL_44_15]